MPILLTPLQQTYANLCKALTRAQNNPQDLEVRDGCIKRFEYTYRLSITALKRYMEQEAVVPEPIDTLHVRDFLRIAFEIGVIQDVNAWFAFREAIKNTSHAYDDAKAEAVFHLIPEFVVQAKFLINALEKQS